MAKIVWLSDGGCTTGFGSVTHHIGERLVRDHGHEIHVLAVNHRGDSFPGVLDRSRPTPLHLYMPTQLKSEDLYGKSRVLELLGKVEPDVIVTVNDPQVILEFLFDNPYDRQRVLLQYRPILAYIPCDGINLVPKWTEILPHVTNPVAMSKWGQSQYPGSKLVYHGVDTNTYYPVTAKRPATTSTGIVCRSKNDCKKAFGIDPDTFLVGRIDSNSGRKDYPALYKALVPVMKRHSNVRAWFHCIQWGSQAGVNMTNLLSRDPDVEMARFMFPDQFNTFSGWPENDMNVLINAFDIFVSTSRGEGFGLNLINAAACGIPIVAQNVSAIPEVVGPGGVLLEPQRLITVPSGEDQWLPDIDAFSDAIENLYSHRRLRKELGAAAAEHAPTMSWDVAATKFDRYIDALAAMANAPEQPSE